MSIPSEPKIEPCPMCGSAATTQAILRMYCNYCHFSALHGDWSRLSQATQLQRTIDDSATREGLAEYAHAAWSGWMRYLFSKAHPNPDGSCTIPSWAVNRWVRQMNTAYAELPESEKQSDRDEADHMLAIVVREVHS